MALPQTYKKKVNLANPIENSEYPNRMISGQAEKLVNKIADKDTYLPLGVLHNDLDAGFKEFIKENMQLTLRGERVPVYMMGIQKWNEFAQTWQNSDEYKNVKIPFIHIVRQPDTKPGTNPSVIYNIPQGKTFTYAQVPTWDGVKKGVDVYKIPQPIAVDITYEVRIFAFKQGDLNRFNQTVLKFFQSRQAYTLVNGHYIPIILEETSDESVLDSLDTKRFYVQLYTFTMLGFLLDPDDFEVVPMINRIFTIGEVTP